MQGLNDLKVMPIMLQEVVPVCPLLLKTQFATWDMGVLWEPVVDFIWSSTIFILYSDRVAERQISLLCRFLRWASGRRKPFRERIYGWLIYNAAHYTEGKAPRYPGASAHLRIFPTAAWSRDTTKQESLRNESLRSNWVPRRVVVSISLLLFLG